MKTLSHPIWLATALGLWFVPAVYAQYVTLSANSSRPSSPLVTLTSNDVATVVSLVCNNGANPPYAYLEVGAGGTTNKFYPDVATTGGEISMASQSSIGKANLVIAGPATIRAVSTTTSPEFPCFCTLQITKPTSTFVPVNTVVIPNDSGAPVNVIMESSIDMISWNAANPGIYGTSSTNRFFRVRAER